MWTALPKIYYSHSDDESGHVKRVEVALLRGKRGKGRSLRTPSLPGDWFAGGEDGGGGGVRE